MPLEDVPEAEIGCGSFAGKSRTVLSEHRGVDFESQKREVALLEEGADLRKRKTMLLYMK